MRHSQFHDMFSLEAHHWWFVSKRRFLAALLETQLGWREPERTSVAVRRSRRIVDLGCGTGGVTQFLSHYGQVIGVEKHPTAVKLARARGLRIQAADLHHFQIPANSTDLVTLCDVLYHQGIDEVAVLRRALRALKPGCHLIITDSALPWLYSSHDLDMEGKRRYYRTELVQLAEQAGFRVTWSSYLFFFTFPLFLAERVGRRLGLIPQSESLTSLPAPLNASLRSLCDLEALLLQWCRFPIGSSVCIIARKV
jgi:SAM-dependent methyltransferase